MIVSGEKFTIRLPRPFRIAHGSSDQRDTILVRAHDPVSGLTGYGEGALPPYYPSTAESSLAWLSQPELEDAPPTAAAARVALDIAQHDLRAQKMGQPLWKIFGLDDSKIPPCVRTVSIPNNESELREEFRRGVALGSRHFKLKSGSGDALWDERCIRLARAEFPETILSVDANEGWSPEVAGSLIASLAEREIAYFEQPVPADWEAWRELRRILGARKVPPLVADESIQSIEDIRIGRDFVQGINVKLLKAGGLTGAQRWIEVARESGLRVLLGGMVETGIGRSATAQLAPLADWLDIDPVDSIPTQPLVGYELHGDRLSLSHRPGLGLLPVA
jgi:L-Ala-D/L-Glu epimerase